MTTPDRIASLEAEVVRLRGLCLEALELAESAWSFDELEYFAERGGIDRRLADIRTEAGLPSEAPELDS